LALSAAACTGSEHTVLRSVELPGPSTGRAGGGAPPAVIRADEPDVVEPAAAGAPAVDPGPSQAPSALDPDVSFDWEQSLPGRGTCRAGVYVGTFQCVTDGLPVLITGQVTLGFSGSSETQLLSVTDGSVGDLWGELFNAGVQGELDCVEQEFSGTTVGGIAYDPLPFGPAAQGFDATMYGVYDDQELVVGGSWLLRYELGGRCTGTWIASAQP
jgi:hypothetical protein